jgi:hypothetical protein
MWFEDLMGFEEISPENVRNNISVKGDKLISKVNNKTVQYGSLEILNLNELRKRVDRLQVFDGKISVKELVSDVKYLHEQLENNKSVFQVASQFNLLEMVGPEVTPERGVAIYENDYTQGPACAIACGAGTIYRNYFASVNGEIGQTRQNQIDCLSDIGIALNNKNLQLWKMKNGYALLSQEGLNEINKKLAKMEASEYEDLKGRLKIGVQWNTEVTINQRKNNVTQAYCSALPVSYSSIESFYWERFARLILEATYEMTFLTALINYEKTGNPKLFLTLIGGGAFGNDTDWILESLNTSLKKFENTPLEVSIVSYGQSNTRIKEYINLTK